MLAWSFMFYYQNPTRKHTWFITINPKIVTGGSKGFPVWFLYWWEKFGPHFDVLPEALKEPWLKWYDYHPKLKGKTAKEVPIGTHQLWYFAEFQIPWIWRWDFEFGFDDLKIPCIYRTYHFKWWDKFDTAATLSTICQRIKEYTEAYKEEQKANFCPPSNIFEYLLKDIKVKYPDLTAIEQNIKVTEIIKEQFLAHHVLSKQTTEKTQAVSTTAKAHVASTSSQPSNSFQSLEDAQNPFDSDTEIMSDDSPKSDATMADYFDGVIALQERQLEKLLGRRQQQAEKNTLLIKSQSKGLDDL